MKNHIILLIVSLLASSCINSMQSEVTLKNGTVIKTENLNNIMPILETVWQENKPAFGFLLRKSTNNPNEDISDQNSLSDLQIQGLITANGQVPTDVKNIVLSIKDYVSYGEPLPSPLFTARRKLTFNPKPKKKLFVD